MRHKVESSHLDGPTEPEETHRGTVQTILPLCNTSKTTGSDTSPLRSLSTTRPTPITDTVPPGLTAENG